MNENCDHFVFSEHLARFTGRFSVPAADCGRLNSNSSHLVSKFVQSINETLTLLTTSIQYELSILQWRKTFCSICYNLTLPEQSQVFDRNKFTAHECQTTMTYLKGILPKLTFDEFLKICIECGFFCELGGLFCNTDLLFQSTVDCVLRKSISLEKIVSLFYGRWKCRCLKGSTEDVVIPSEDIESLQMCSNANASLSSECVKTESVECLLLVSLVSDLEVVKRDWSCSLENYHCEQTTISQSTLPHSSFSSSLIHLKQLALHISKILDEMQQTISNDGTHKKLSNSVGSCSEAAATSLFAKFWSEFNKVCYLAGLYDLMAVSSDCVESCLEKDEGYSELDLALHSVKFNLCDSQSKFCYIIDCFAKNDVFYSRDQVNIDHLMNVLSDKLSYFLYFAVIKVLLDSCFHLCCYLDSKSEDDLNSNNSISKTKKLQFLVDTFFNHLKLIEFEIQEKLRVHLYQSCFKAHSSSYLKWSSYLTDRVQINLSKLTECFNKLNPKDFNHDTSVMLFLSQCTFAIPDKIIEKAIKDAFSSRGKTMLIQQLFERFNSLTRFSIVQDEHHHSVPYIIEVIATTSVININSACQFVNFTATQFSPEISPQMVYKHGLLPKFKGNKVNAVKLFTTLSPLLPNEMKFYVAILDKFFANQGVLKDASHINMNWLKEFQKLGFEELQFDDFSGETESNSNVLVIRYRDIMIRNNHHKCFALQAFFATTCTALPKFEYDTSKITLSKLPEFVHYSEEEVVITLLSFIQSVKLIDIRALALSIKMLLGCELMGAGARQLHHMSSDATIRNTSSLNFRLWKMLITLFKLSISCEQINIPQGFFEGFSTLVKGILKWLKLETTANNNTSSSCGDNNLSLDENCFCFFCLNMMLDVLLCCNMTLDDSREAIFRDAFYILVDQVTILSKAADCLDSPTCSTLDDDDKCLRDELVKCYEKLYNISQLCKYSLPNQIDVFIKKKYMSKV